MAQIIKTTGEVIEVTPKNRIEFTLEELQEIVGGYVEFVFLENNQIMVVNEEGKLIDLEYNEKATEMYQEQVSPFDIIVGDVLVCNDNQIG